MSAPSTAKTVKRLTPRQWAEIEALWESGETTLEQLATKFGRDKSSIQRYLTKHKIIKGSNVAENKAAIKEAVTASIVDDATILASRIRETNEEHYKMSSAMAKLAWSEILTAKKDNKAFSTIKDNLKSLDLAMNVLSKARIERYAVLGLDKSDFVDEDGLPELVISELTADQVEELRNRDDVGIEDGVDAIIAENLDDDDLDDAGNNDIVSEEE